jgi:hypothetical protein
MKKQYRLQYIVIPSLFIVFLFTPVINELFQIIDNDLSKAEKRKLSEKPSFNVTYLDPYPTQYEAYYNDHFGLRKFYIDFNNYVQVDIFNTNSSKKVIIGEDDWLFQNNKFIPRLNKKYSDKQKQKFVDKVKYRNKYFNERNIKHYIFIIPAKASVYTEKIPDYLQSTDKDFKNSTEDLLEHVKKANISNVIYFKDALVKAKEKYPVYFKYDHHWNKHGGFVGSQIIIEKLSKDFKSITNLQKPENYNVKAIQSKYKDLAAFIGLSKELSESQYIYKPKKAIRKFERINKKKYEVPKSFKYKDKFEINTTTYNKDLPSIFVIRDSFSRELIEFISPYFNNATYIWDNWTYKIHPEKVKKEKPDVVITVIAERKLFALMK